MVARDWETFWAKRVLLNAEMSTCLKRHVGAVAVIHNRAIADGFNGNLPGARHCDTQGGCARCADDTIPSGTKLELCTCVHAEQNVVAYAARLGISLIGSTLYCTHRPCHDCFKLVVSAGIDDIAFLEDYPATYRVPHVQITLRKFG